MPATKNTNTPRRGQDRGRRGYGAAANAHVYAGTLAVLTAGGLAPGTVGTGLIAVGVCESEVDNRGGGAGHITAGVVRGVFRLANSAGADEISQADIGQRCWIVDDLTVALTDGDGTRSIAGIIDDVDDSGVWVLIDPTSGALLAPIDAEEP